MSVVKAQNDFRESVQFLVELHRINIAIMYFINLIKKKA